MCVCVCVCVCDRERASEREREREREGEREGARESICTLLFVVSILSLHLSHYLFVASVL